MTPGRGPSQRWPPNGLPWWVHLAGFLFGLRMIQLRINVVADAITVVNFVQIHRVEWDQVASIESVTERMGSRLMLRRVDGKVIKSDGVSSLGPFGRAAVHDRTEELATRLAETRRP